MPSRPASPALVRFALGTVGAVMLAIVGVLVWAVATPIVAGRPAQTAANPAPKQPVPPAPKPAPADPSHYVIKQALTIDKQMRHGDWVWDASKAPATGQVLITVDLKAQMMSVFRDGYEIGVAVIEHGADDKPTPLGVFPILEKDAHHRSSLYVDDAGRPAPMPWALRLTRTGVFIHGAKIRIDWGSNGCVGIPDEFAEKLFGVAGVGDPVIVTAGAVMAVGDDIHPK